MQPFLPSHQFVQRCLCAHPGKRIWSPQLWRSTSPPKSAYLQEPLVYDRAITAASELIVETRIKLTANRRVCDQYEIATLWLTRRCIFLRQMGTPKTSINREKNHRN